MYLQDKEMIPLPPPTKPLTVDACIPYITYTSGATSW